MTALVCASVTSSCIPVGDCDENSTSVQWARQLSQARLERLYKDMKRFADTGKKFYRAQKGSKESPPELADLEYYDVILDDLRARLMLAGCFDHYIVISLEGVVDDRSPRIALSWGEHEEAGSETLWPK